MNKLDLQRLARRIEDLQRQHTGRWDPADALTLRNSLPGSRTRQALPDPAELRRVAEGPVDGHPPVRDYQGWLQQVLRLEGLVHDNRPGNMKRVIRDMARGRPPRW